MNVGRGAHSAINWCASTGMSPAFLLPKLEAAVAVLEEVAGHPVVLAGAGEVLDRLAEVAAVQLRAALAGRADEHHGEPLVERHRDQRRLAVTRHAVDADALRVDGRIGLEVVERAGRAPGPGAQRAPVFGLAPLTLVDEADDALRQAGTVVGLHARGVQERVAPTRRDQLLGRRRIGAGWRRRHSGNPAAAGRTGRERQRPAPEHDHHRHRALRLAGVTRITSMSTSIDGATRVVDATDQPAADDWPPPTTAFRHARVTDQVTFGTCGGTRPSTSRSKSSTISGRRCVPPVRRRRDALAVLQRQRVGPVGERVGLRFVVVRVIGRILAARSARVAAP